MKKVIFVLLSCLVVAMMTSCNDDVVPYDGGTVVYPTENTTQPVALEGDKIDYVEAVEEEEKEEKVDVSYDTVTIDYEDPDGYDYEVTYQISPWIFSSNEEMINATWKELGCGKDLPTIDSLYLEKNGNFYQTDFLDCAKLLTYNKARFLMTSLDDYYVCMGNITIKNVTDGWSFDENNPREFNVILGVEDSNSEWGDFASVFGRIIFSDGSDEDYIHGVRAAANMKGDKWGAVPFVLFAREDITPNSPDGVEWSDILTDYSYHSYLTSSFTDKDDPLVDIKPRVIGKDGEELEAPN